MCFLCRCGVLAILLMSVFKPTVVQANPGDEVLARADLAAYHGWIKYLQFEAGVAAERFGAESPLIAERAARLADWSQRILANPNLLHELRGVQEWAYLSPADGSGQPFQINIPTDYDPARPAPVSLYMHGYSGNHLEHATGWPRQTEWFTLSVLGRARGGRYVGLSEADVLGVLDYVEAHWAIDPARVHLNGGSMGGGGTFWLGSRYPQRFASGRPTCGYAGDKPLGNLLTLPIYATHSDDDPTVPVLQSRGATAWLRAHGGMAIQDETTGLGHAAWDYAAGNARGDAWFRRQVRPDARSVRRIDYTATDGVAVRGWWGEVAEWGPAARPARFVLTAGAGNQLYAELTNVARLRLHVAESPFDAAQPLQVSVDGHFAFTVPAPLSPEIVLTRGEAGWTVEEQAPRFRFRLHTPGGINQLYNGEPLLIVYGTHGTAEMVAAQKAAAEIARRSVAGTWSLPNGENGVDGVSHNQLLYGILRAKADVDVTATDLTANHLVLIGTAAENAVVAQIADRLPVTLGTETVAFSDGLSLPIAGTALGLLHYNPLAPERLLFWTAAQTPDGYRGESMVSRLMSGEVGFGRNVGTGVDCLVIDPAKSQVQVARSFDSRWSWSDDRAHSPLLPATGAGLTGAEMADAMAQALRLAVGANFAVSARGLATIDQPYVPGVTRHCDLLNLGYFEPVGVITLTGAQLQKMAGKLAGSGVALRPAVNETDARADRRYRVAVLTQDLWPLMRAAVMPVDGYEQTDLTSAEAYARFLVTE